MERLKKAAAGLKNKLQKTDSEKLVISAIKGNEVTLKTTYYSIADLTYSYEECKNITKVIWTNLSPDEKNAEKVLKTLQLVEALLKLAHPSCISELRTGVGKIRSFLDFYSEGKGLDYGGTVRELARKILQLMGNDQILEEERETARKQRERSVGFSSDQYSNGNMSRKNELMEGSSKNNGYAQSAAWYEQGKINLGPDQSYVPPVPEKKQDFSKAQTEKNDLFSGMVFKQENKKEKVEVPVNKGFDIFQEQKKEKVEAPVNKDSDIFQENKKETAPTRKKISIGELNLGPTKTISKNEGLPPVFESSLGDLFGVQYTPQKPSKEPEKIDLFSMLSNKNPLPQPEKTQTPIVEPKKLFGIPLKSQKAENPIISTPKPSQPPDYFDILSLKTDFSSESKKISEKTTENPQTFPMVFKPIIAYKLSDPFDFNSEYPTLIQPEKPQAKKIPIKNLEASLMNIDDLLGSLSNSIGPRALDNIEL